VSGSETASFLKPNHCSLCLHGPFLSGETFVVRCFVPTLQMLSMVTAFALL
jgi:hypothetical protein